MSFDFNAIFETLRAKDPELLLFLPEKSFLAFFWFFIWLWGIGNQLWLSRSATRFDAFYVVER